MAWAISARCCWSNQYGFTTSRAVPVEDLLILRIAIAVCAITAERPTIFEVTIGFYVENWVYKRLATFSQIRPLHMAVTDTRFCTSKASAPSIASLSDGVAIAVAIRQ